MAWCQARTISARVSKFGRFDLWLPLLWMFCSWYRGVVVGGGSSVSFTQWEQQMNQANRSNRKTWTSMNKRKNPSQTALLTSRPQKSSNSTRASINFSHIAGSPWLCNAQRNVVQCSTVHCDEDEDQKFLGKLLFFSGRAEETFNLIKSTFKDGLDRIDKSFIRSEFKLWIVFNILLSQSIQI